MPTYESKCTNDGSTFDIWQEVGSPAPPCPDCGAPTKKVFAPPRVIFKGSGFYVTDKRAEDSGAKAGKSQSAETKSDDKSSTDSAASESKSEGATETKTGAKTDAPPADAKKNEVG